MEGDEDMQVDGSSDGEGQKEGKGRRGVTWDEETIAEHDKLRGTRQKIDEPPTPYHVSFEPADGASDSGDDSSRRHSRSNSVSSAPGTPNQKKGEPGYLAEHWHVLTSALEEAARNRDALASRASASASAAAAGGGTGSPGLALSRSDSNSSAASHLGGRRRTTSFSSDSEQERQSEERRQQSTEHAQFAKKRVSHYDEFKRLQEWRKKHAAGEDEDEDEDDEDEEGEGDGGGKAGGEGEGDSGSEQKKKKRSWLPAFSAGSR